MPVFFPAELTATIGPMLENLGVDRDSAGIVVQHLVEAELCGVRSHGLIRVPQYVGLLKAGKISPQARLSLERETVATAVLRGQHGFGQVMARGAMQLAIQKAAAVGIGATTLMECSHTGRLASYALQAVEHGMIGIVMVNAGGHGQWVAPFGGIAGRLATNPFSIAAPAIANEPIVLDVATSIAPEGKIRSMFNSQQPIPLGWVIDDQGRSTTNPADLYGPPRGALLPFGGHKGYGLALLVDVIAGALSGAGCCRDANAPLAGDTDGVFLLAINPTAFCTTDEYLAQVEGLCRHVRSSPPAAGCDRVMIPGELEWTTRRRNLESGLSIDDATWALIEPLLPTN